MINLLQRATPKPRLHSKTDYIEFAFQQLSQIFPQLEKNAQLRLQIFPDIEVDLLAHSTSGQLVLFEIKHVLPKSSLGFSAYPSAAALQDTVNASLLELSPIVVVLSTGPVDQPVRDMFKKARIPVVALSTKLEETFERLKEAFKYVALDLPEVTGESDKNTLIGNQHVYQSSENAIHIEAAEGIVIGRDAVIKQQYEPNEEAFRSLERLQQQLAASQELNRIRVLLREKAATVNAELVETMIFLADHYSGEGEMETAGRLADLAKETADVLGDHQLRADSSFIRAVIYQHGSHLLEAREHYQQAAKIYEDLGADPQRANCLGNLGLIAQDLGDSPQAIKYHETALEIARRTGNLSAQLADLTNLSAVYYSQDDYRRAEEGYQEVLRLAIEASELEDEMNALAGLGLIHRARGELDNAHEHFERALAIARRNNHHRAEAAHLGNLGLVSQDLGDLGRALELHQDAATLHATMGNRQGQANQLGNAANVYYALGDLPMAEALHRQALELHRATGFRRGQAQELGNLALVCRVQGDYAGALALTDAALQIDQEIDDRRGEAADWGNLGMIYTQLGDYDRARRCLLRALEIDREIGYVQDEANHLANLAELNYRLGDVSAALEGYAEALRVNERVGYPAGIASQLANLGAILASPGTAAEGREYLQRALALDEAMGNARAQVADLANLGNASFALEEMAEALEYQTRAVSLALSLSDVDLAARTLAGRGETYEMLGQLEAARTDYAAAVERLELLRASVLEESHQIGFFAHGKPEIYQRLARVSVRLGDAMGAFVIVQKAKSRAMRALLGRSRLDPPSTADQSLLVREQALQMRLNECLANATKAPEEKKQLRWNAQAAEVAEQLKAIWEQLRASAQEYVDLRQAMPFTLFDAGRLLTTPAG